MGNRISNVEPCGKMVLLKFLEVKQDLYIMKGSLLVSNEKATDVKKKVYAVVEKLGPDIDASTISFKVGDRVFYNDYDCKTFGDEDSTWGLTKVESIWAVYEEIEQ
jgi:co-chaperonin GroES (HSP10)